MATISKRRTDLDEIAIRIAIARGAGHTIERTAELAGCSQSTVYSRLDQVPDIKALEAFVRLCCETSIGQQVALTADAMKKEWEKRRGKVLEVHDKAMDMVEFNPAIALKAAEGIADRLDGKATQTVKTEGTQTVEVTYKVPTAILEAWENGIKELTPARAQLAAPSELPVIDITPIATESV